MPDASQHRKASLMDHLKVAILTQELAPGADLDESELSKAFGLSRTPLREVFRELAGQGYLELRAGRGARISDMSYRTLRDFFVAAPMIYGAILRLAARNATPQNIAELKAAQAEFRQALASGSARARALANNRFHEITGDMAGNIYLLPSFRRLLIDHARIGMTFYHPRDVGMHENLAVASDHHDAIIAAIEAGREDEAALLADAHWTLSRDRIELFVMPQALDIPLGDFPLKPTA